MWLFADRAAACLHTTWPKRRACISSAIASRIPHSSRRPSRSKGRHWAYCAAYLATPRCSATVIPAATSLWRAALAYRVWRTAVPRSLVRVRRQARHRALVAGAARASPFAPLSACQRRRNAPFLPFTRTLLPHCLGNRTTTHAACSPRGFPALPRRRCTYKIPTAPAHHRAYLESVACMLRTQHATMPAA